MKHKTTLDKILYYVHAADLQFPMVYIRARAEITSHFRRHIIRMRAPLAKNRMTSAVLVVKLKSIRFFTCTKIYKAFRCRIFKKISMWRRYA